MWASTPTSGVQISAVPVGANAHIGPLGAAIDAGNGRAVIVPTKGVLVSVTQKSRDGKPSRDCLFGVFRLLCQFFGEGFLTLLTPEVIPDEAAKTPEEVAVA